MQGTPVTPCKPLTAVGGPGSLPKGLKEAETCATSRVNHRVLLPYLAHSLRCHVLKLKDHSGTISKI